MTRGSAGLCEQNYGDHCTPSTAGGTLAASRLVLRVLWSLKCQVM